MRIGFAQFAPVLGDRDATIGTIDRLAPQFAGADLVVLPELCNSGYNFTSNDQAWETSETVEDGPFVRYLCDLCASSTLHIVAGINERDGDRLYNTSVLVGPGGVLGTYRKMHLFVNEPDFFTPGDVGLPVFDLPKLGVKIGMLICFDWVFPETWRALTLQGADIICHPSNLVLPGLCQSAVPTHALCNGIFAITANRTGTEGDLTFTGLSIVADPRGRVLCHARGATDEVCLVDVDLADARDKMVTPRNHLLRDRRPEEYRLLCEECL
ncbi:MAG: hypothetical protein KAS72_15225 [Phycisphaerales bacterium]|nr:hypothetical protein [Phycisphaerales bacterium]